MAIFSGTFTDPDGHKWEKSAKLLQTWTGGGSVCARRTHIRPPAYRSKFVRISRQIRDRWWNVLSQANRDSYTALAAQGPSSRDGIDRTPSNGYILYQALVFAHYWDHGSTVVLDPEPQAGPFTAGTIDAIDVPNQTVTYSAAWQSIEPLCILASLSVYQINPLDLYGPLQWRQTRLIDWTQLLPAHNLGFTHTVALAWPAVAGTAIRLFFRGNRFPWYTWHHQDRLVA